MPVSHENVQQAFADALSHVQVATTPNDGGLTESAIQILRDMVAQDPNFQKQFNEKLQAVATQKQEAILAAQQQAKSQQQTAGGNQAPAPEVQPAQQGNTGGSQQGDHAAANAAPGTEGGLNADSGGNSQ